MKNKKKKNSLRVRKTLCHVYVDLVDHDKNILDVSSTLSLKLGQANVENCFKVGRAIAEKALKKNVTSVFFDRNGILYHGKIKSLAEGARDAGLEF